MAKLMCLCGAVISMSEIPDRKAYLLLSESCFDSIDASSNLNTALKEMEAESSEVYLCPECKRLVVFWKRGEAVPTFYDPVATEGGRDYL